MGNAFHQLNANIVVADGLSLTEHAARSGISYSTLDKRGR
jgi:hypothetical protein